MYGYFDDSAYQPGFTGGPRYSANPVSSHAGAGGYSGSHTEAGGMGASPNVSSVTRSFGQNGGYDMAPAKYKGDSVDWGGIAGGVGGMLTAFGSDIAKANQLGAAAQLAGSDIPMDPRFMQPGIIQALKEGMQLRDSTLGKMPREAARTAGARAAEQRGLSGPLAASVAANSEQEAQQAYDRYRMGALENARGNYLQLVMAYKKMAADRLAKLQQLQMLQRQANAAGKPEGFAAKYGLGAAGGILGYLLGGGTGAQIGSQLGMAGGGLLMDSMGAAAYDPRLLDAESQANSSAFGSF